MSFAFAANPVMHQGLFLESLSLCRFCPIWRSKLLIILPIIIKTF